MASCLGGKRESECHSTQTLSGPDSLAILMLQGFSLNSGVLFLVLSCLLLAVSMSVLCVCASYSLSLGAVHCPVFENL